MLLTSLSQVELRSFPLAKWPRSQLRLIFPSLLPKHALLSLYCHTVLVVLQVASRNLNFLFILSVISICQQRFFSNLPFPYVRSWNKIVIALKFCDSEKNYRIWLLECWLCFEITLFQMAEIARCRGVCLQSQVLEGWGWMMALPTGCPP